MRLVEKKPSGCDTRCAGLVPVIGPPSAAPARELGPPDALEREPALRMLTTSRCRLSARCFSAVQPSVGESGSSGAPVTPAKKYLPSQRSCTRAH